jgi:hypothetical protein
LILLNFYRAFAVNKKFAVLSGFMDSSQAKLLLPAASLLEFLGVLTLITNDGMLIPKVDLGFSVPAVLPVEIQGIGLLIAGGLTMAFAIMNLN